MNSGQASMRASALRPPPAAAACSDLGCAAEARRAAVRPARGLAATRRWLRRGARPAEDRPRSPRAPAAAPAVKKSLAAAKGRPALCRVLAGRR
jgi:hypothetical protein